MSINTYLPFHIVYIHICLKISMVYKVYIDVYIFIFTYSI